MEKEEFDAISEQSESVNDKPLEGIYEFDWKNKWLKGKEMKKFKRIRIESLII